MDHYTQGFYSFGFVNDTMDTPDLQYLQKRSQEYAQFSQRFTQPPLPPPETVPPPPPPEPHTRQNNQYRQNYGRLSPLIPQAPSENGLQPQPLLAMHHGQSNTNRYNNRRYSNNHNRYNSNQSNHHNNNRHINLQNNYHNQPQNSYHNNPSSNHQQSNNRQDQMKRSPPEDDDCPRSKRSRKKKKSLANSNTVLRHWTEESAKLVLETEKELNGLDHQKQLIIKFPDEDLNRDIVLRFHSSITKVHFQHPSTPRYCFITLDEESDPESVIKVLNKTPFGHGFLTAERKNPREAKHTDARDVDVCTLFVGNLPNHIKHAEVSALYPEARRIDIGYAAVQRYKRYAFVHFYTAEDALTAYRRTFNRNSSSNSSMVVRFRRVNGSASMPNERKVQNPPRSPRQGETSGKGPEYGDDEEDDLEEEEEEHACEDRVQPPVDEDNTSQVSEEKIVKSVEEDPVESLEKLLQMQPEDEKTVPASEKPAEITVDLPSTVKIKAEPVDEMADEPEDLQAPWSPQLPVAYPKEPKKEITTPDDLDIPVKMEVDDQLNEYFQACADYETSNVNIEDLLRDEIAASIRNKPLNTAACGKGDNLYADISNTLSTSIDHAIKEGPVSGLLDKPSQQ